jgi:hypothetical protein
MIEVMPNLFVGDQSDETRIRGQAGWFVIHACKEPYHRQALGYSGQGAPKALPEYLIARREGRLILNLVDVPNVAFISPLIMDAAIAATHENIGSAKVLVHCNQGMSRSPTIALLYMAQHGKTFAGLSFEEARAKFLEIYPLYNPAKGVADYAALNWTKYNG